MGEQAVSAQSSQSFPYGTSSSRRGLHFAVAALIIAMLSGCAVDVNDIRHWELTERGPEKLVAVLNHDKYGSMLRSEAALSLIRMKPRGGRRIGIELMTGSLASVPPEGRRDIVDAMAPELIKQIDQPPPGHTPDGVVPPDLSVPYKDAAFALISHEPTLVDNEKTRADLTAVLIQWGQVDFESRIENSAQQYGVEQVMHFLGAPAARGLPALITPDSSKVDRIASLVSDLADPETKTRASIALVALAKYLESPEWIAKQTPVVKQANERAKMAVTPEQVKVQISKYQDQELTKVFAAMKRVGGRPVIDYALAYAADKNNKSEERRKAALASLEGRMDKGNAADIEHVFEIAKDADTPDGVRDLAFARLGELPRDLVLPKLYSLFEGQKWKIRWVAGTLALKSITVKGLAEFMHKLPASAGTKMGMSEPISYGSIIAKMDAPAGEPKPNEAILPYLSDRSVGAKLTALGFFYGGKKSDLGIVRAHAEDSTPVSKCDAAEDCGWTCEIAKSPTERETKTIATVGEFAKYCVEPSMDAP